MRPICCVSLPAFFCAGSVLGVDKKIISLAHSKPGGKHSQGILIGTLYVSGQGGEDAAGRIPSDFDAENVGAVLKGRRDVARGRRKRPDVHNRRSQISTNECRLYELLQRSAANKDHSDSRGLVGPGIIEITVTARKQTRDVER
jgi:hypothetical protein